LKRAAIGLFKQAAGCCVILAFVFSSAVSPLNSVLRAPLLQGDAVGPFVVCSLVGPDSFVLTNSVPHDEEPTNPTLHNVDCPLCRLPDTAPVILPPRIGIISSRLAATVRYEPPADAIWAARLNERPPARAPPA